MLLVELWLLLNVCEKGWLVALWRGEPFCWEGGMDGGGGGGGKLGD